VAKEKKEKKETSAVGGGIISAFINSCKYKRIKATAKGMDGQIKVTTYTIPEHHKTHTETC